MTRSTEAPNQLLRAHDGKCEATIAGAVDPTRVCHCRDRADVAAAKLAGPIVLELADLDDLEDGLHAGTNWCDNCGDEPQDDDGEDGLCAGCRSADDQCEWWPDGDAEDGTTAEELHNMNCGKDHQEQRRR